MEIRSTQSYVVYVRMKLESHFGGGRHLYWYPGETERCYTASFKSSFNLDLSFLLWTLNALPVCVYVCVCGCVLYWGFVCVSGVC